MEKIINEQQNFKYQSDEFTPKPSKKIFRPNRKIKSLEELEREDVRIKGVRVNVGEELGDKIFRKIYNVGKLRRLNPITGQMEEVGLEDRNMNLLELLSKSYDLVQNIQTKQDADAAHRLINDVILILKDLQNKNVNLTDLVGDSTDKLLFNLETLQSDVYAYILLNDKKYIADAYRLSVLLKDKLRIPAIPGHSVSQILERDLDPDEYKQIQDDTGIVINNATGLAPIVKAYLNDSNTGYNNAFGKNQILDSLKNKIIVIAKLLDINDLRLFTLNLNRIEYLESEIEFVKFVSLNIDRNNLIQQKYKTYNGGNLNNRTTLKSPYSKYNNELKIIKNIV